MIHGIQAALPNPSFLRSEKSSAIDLSSSDRTAHNSSRHLVFVVNPKGANGRTGKEWKKLLPYLRSRLGSDCNVHESLTSGPSHAIDITREAIREGADAVIAVGGDGMKTRIDIGAISGESGEPHYFINVADIHLSAKAGFYASRYKGFGNLCYVIGALRAFMSHRNRDLRIKVNEGDWEIFPQVTALCIGNAKFFGGGMKITPSADPCNGNLEVVILQDFKWYDFVLKLHKLYKGTHLSEKNVCSRSVCSIEVEEVVSSGSIYVQSDGEHLGFLPRRFCILPGAIEMLN